MENITEGMLRRPRRNRKSEAIRNMVEETILRPSNLVLPMFLAYGENVNEKIASLPMSARLSLDLMIPEIGRLMALGLKSFMIFPAVPESLKDKTASYSHDENNFYLKAAVEIKKQFPDCVLISDVAMDPYSSDGHDGYVENGEIINDITLPILADMAVAQARSGFDVIGPSDMMDGRVGIIRKALDLAGFTNTSIMSYTAKYASAFYGPFRDALDSAPKSGDKKTYQMNPANRREAIIEATLDEQEGADFLMVKPALHYLDVISALKAHSNLPIAAYHVSGECAMLYAATQNGWLNLDKALTETFMSLRRAGADCIISYFSAYYCERLASA